MHKFHLLSVLAVIVLTGCQAQQAEPYDKAKSPENRQNYSGLKGTSQYVKDQQYIQQKELDDKCDEAKMDLITANENSDDVRSNELKLYISEHCR